MTYSTLTRLIAAGFLLGTLATPAAAAKNYGEGRIGNPSKLRVPKDRRPPGRIMKRTPIPEPEERQPSRASATIPSPEPAMRGGGGYERNGKYFYALPRDIELKRYSKPGSGYTPTIPRPEPVGLERRPKSAASISRPKRPANPYNDDYSTGSSTGSLGNLDK